jgi:hypothetical protein
MFAFPSCPAPLSRGQALVSGIHVLLIRAIRDKDVDGQLKLGHDEEARPL